MLNMTSSCHISLTVGQIGDFLTIYLERLLGSDFQTFCLCLLQKTKQLKAQPKLVDLGRETSHSVHLV
jgi:hypothetical protein